MKRKGKARGLVLMFVFILLTGVVYGAIAGEFLFALSDTTLNVVEIFLALSLFLVMTVVAFILQIIIHEAGHLLFGLFTKYRFISFRIFSFIWFKDQGKIKLKRLAIAGTAGQCIMLPPENPAKNPPFLLYNLGGCLLNFLTFVVFLTFSLILNGVVLPTFLFLLSSFGLVFALLNGIPMSFPLVNNDGHNTLTLLKNSKAPHVLWLMLTSNEYIIKGIRVKDFPEKFFVEPMSEDMNNSIIAGSTFLIANRLIDKHQFIEAAEYLERVLSIDSALIGLHRRLMICDQILCELLNENRKDKLNTLLDQNQKLFMKEMKNYPSVVRTEYAYALLGLNDTEKAKNKRIDFEQCALTYPYPIEIVSEREILDIIDASFQSRVMVEQAT